MKFIFLITFIYCTKSLANADQLIDIKPIYSDYNYTLMVPLTGLLLFVFLYLLKKVFIIFKHRYQSEKTVIINWPSLCDQALNDSNLTPKQLEFELIHIIKSMLEHKLSLKVTAKNDDELINYLLNSNKEEVRELNPELKNSVQEFFRESSQVRFSSGELSINVTQKRGMEAKSICKMVEEISDGRKQ